jgi:hypothetical protein
MLTKANNNTFLIRNQKSGENLPMTQETILYVPVDNLCFDTRSEPVELNSAQTLKFSTNIELTQFSSIEQDTCHLNYSPLTLVTG